MKNSWLSQNIAKIDKHVFGSAMSGQITLEETVSLSPKAYMFKYNVAHIKKIGVDIELGDNEITLNISDNIKDLPGSFAIQGETASKTILTKKIKISDDMETKNIRSMVNNGVLTVNIPRTGNLPFE